MAILKGQDLILFTGTLVAPVVLAQATSCDLSISNEQLDVTSKSSGDYEEFIAGRINWSISTGGLVNFEETNGYLVLDAAILAGTEIQIVVGVATKAADTTPNDALDATAGLVTYSGTVLVESLDLTTGNAGEISSYSASLKGTGQLVRTVQTV